MDHRSSMIRNSEVHSGREAWGARIAWLRRWLAVCGLILIAATWRLWTPQDFFPQIPSLAALRDAPEWLDWLGLGTLVASLLGLLLLPRRTTRQRDLSTSDESDRKDVAAPAPLTPGPSPQGEGGEYRSVLRVFALLFVAALTLLVLLNQHRLQVWAYQFAIVIVVTAFASGGRAASLLRLLVIGIYFWSAVSKFDYTFLHSTGPDLLRGLLTGLQLDPARVDAETASRVAWLFPVWELGTAILLAIRKTRTFGLLMALAMHGALLITLGPLGLNHEPGVLLWNTFFIGQDLLLFLRPRVGWQGAAGPNDGRIHLADLQKRKLPRVRSLGIEHIAVGLGVWLPILEPFGLLDHWPAWGVYAPGAERVTLLIDADAAEDLSEDVRRHLGPVQFATDARVLRTDRWSFEALSTPIYPQGRFRAGVALAVIDRFDVGEEAALVVESRADRLSGERASRTFEGTAAIRQYAESFRLNALPRGSWSD